MSRKLVFFLLLIFPLTSVLGRVLTYEEAVQIALKESYMIKSFEQQKLEMEYGYRFRKAEFKPRFDAMLFEHFGISCIFECPPCGQCDS